MPDKFKSEEAEKTYIPTVLDPVTDHTMAIIFTDGSAQGNPGPVGNGTVIKKQGLLSSPVNAGDCINNAGELETIKLDTDFAVKIIGNARNLFMYSDSQSPIQSVMGQNTESYHNITIRGIGSNLIELRFSVDEIKMIYCPAHKGIYENEMAESLAKVAPKKAIHLPPKIHLTMSDLKNVNTQMTIDKWSIRRANSNSHKYKELVVTICENSLKH